MTHVAVTYSFIGLDDTLEPNNPFRRRAFVPDGQDPAAQLTHTRWNILIHDIQPATDAAFKGRYWYVAYVEKSTVLTVLSTIKILLLLDRRRTVWVISGPFDTEGAARYDMDVRWESHE